MIRSRLRWVVPCVIVFIGCDSPLEPGAGTSARRLAVGESTTCALDKDGHVHCWGLNSSFMEFGVSNATLPGGGVAVEVPVPRLVSISAGAASHMCGITEDHSAICWGRGGAGQLGAGVVGDAGNASVTVSTTEKWKDVRVGRLTSCAVSEEGKGYCWGQNQRGEVGDTLLAINARRSTPSLVIGGITFTSIVPGWLHTCGISVSGAAYCWGDNSSGQLGIGFADGDPHGRPLIVSFTQQFTKLAVGSRSTCGITSDGRTLCWGYNGTGQLGDGTRAQRHEPTEVVGGLKFREIAISSGFGAGSNATLPTGISQGGIAHTCGLTEAGAMYCWGWNGAGQLGDGTKTDRLTPVLVSGTQVFTSFGLGSSSSCGVTPAALFCWGGNFYGQLGNLSFTDSAIPVKVDGSFWP